MRARVDRSRLAAGLMGAAILAQLVVLRAVSAANGEFVMLAGRELQWGCAFRQAFGVPCPNCGMTRSVVFSLHGDMGRAFALNPAGPLLVAGGLLLGLALLFAAFPRRAEIVRAEPAAAAPMRRIMIAAACYGGLVFAVLIVNWVRLIT